MIPRRRPRRGYAMILLVSVAMVLSTLSLALVTSAESGLAGSRLLLGRTEARTLAVSALEEFYAQIEANDAFLDPLLDSDDATRVAHPAFSLPSERATASERWAALSGGAPRTCAGLDENCYTITTVLERNPTTGLARALVVDATARVRCGGVASRCVYARYQERLRLPEFFDSLLFYQFATLDPALYTTAPLDKTFAEANCAERYAWRTNPENQLDFRSPDCVDVAFRGDLTGQRDIVSGPVYTADDWISTCGSPLFTDKVRVAGAGYAPAAPTRVWASVTEPRPDPATKALATDAGDRAAIACPAGAPEFPAGGEVLGADLRSLPSLATAAQAEALTTSEYIFTPAGSAPVTVQLVTTGTGAAAVTRMVVSGSTADVPAPGRVLPASGVVVVRGSVNLSGVLAGTLSLFADGQVRIVGNVTYAGGADLSNRRDVLGVTANGPIVVTQTPGGADRQVHAVAISVTDSIYVEGWDTSQGWTSAPALRWFGSLTSRYQGVFGGFGASGALVSGYRKEFTFDTRLTNGALVPPYLVAPESDGWIRLSMQEVAVDRPDV